MLSLFINVVRCTLYVVRTQYEFVPRAHFESRCYFIIIMWWHRLLLLPLPPSPLTSSYRHTAIPPTMPSSTLLWTTVDDVFVWHRKRTTSYLYDLCATLILLYGDDDGDDDVRWMDGWMDRWMVGWIAKDFSLAIVRERESYCCHRSRRQQQRIIRRFRCLFFLVICELQRMR